MEEVGLSLIAQGADKFLADMDRAEKASDAFARGIDRAAGIAGAGANMLGGLGAAAGGVLVGGLAAATGAAFGLGAALVSASERAAAVRNALGQDLGAEAITEVADAAGLLEQRFGVDLQTQLGAARQLVANGLAPDFATAMDVITAGFENGLNAGDDLLDTLTEYSPNFSALGISGDEALGIINRGLEAGARNSDVIGDAVKEFGILIRETGAPDEIAKIDRGLGTLVGQFQEGKIAGDEALTLITDRLAAIENPIARNQAGIALFGTLYEDMGESAILALGQTETGLINSAGASEEAAARIASFGEILPRIFDELAPALIPASDALLGLANDVWPQVEEAISDGAALVNDFVAAFAAGDWEGVGAIFSELGEQVGGFALELGERIADAAPVALQELGRLGGELGGWAQQQAPVWAGQLGALAQELGGWVVKGAPEMLAKLGDARNELVGWVLGSIPAWAAGLGQLGGKLGQWVLDALPGLGTNLGQVAAVLVAKTGELIAIAVPKLAELGVEFTIWVARDVLPNLPGALVQVGSAILTAARNFLAEVTPELVKLGGQFVNWVNTDVLPELPGKMSEIGDAILDGIGGFIGGVGTAAAGIGRDIADGIGDGFQGAWDRVTDWITDQIARIPEPIRRALGISSPSKVMADEVGQHIPAGIAMGMLEGQGAIDDAARQIADDTLVTFEDGSIGPRGGIDMGASLVTGMAHGILDNVDLLLDAAGEISRAVLDEAGGLAEEIRSAVGPMLADGFRGAADFARSRLGTLDLLGGFGDLEAPEAPEEVAEVDLGRLNTLKAQQAAARREFERALAGPVRTERDVQRLNDLEERRRLADEALAQEEERVRLARLSRAEEQAERQEAFAEAQRVYEAQRDIQQRAAAELEELEAQARTITDAGERASFYGFRQRQIQELAEAELDAATARGELEQRIARDRLAAIREAQQFETQLARQEAQARQSDLRDNIRIAEDATRRLAYLVQFSQEDVLGASDPAIAGVGATLGSMLSGLGQQVGGPATMAGLLTALLGGGGGSNIYGPTFNYNPTYQGAPNAPMQDFAIMQSLYGAGA